MLKLRISPLVVKDLKEIRNYIAEDNPQKAVEVIEEIYGKFENVQLFPGIEYSCAMKSHFRKSGNQMSGKWKSSYVSLLA